MGIVKNGYQAQFSKKMFILEALIEDETGEITAIWFNQII